MSYQRGPEKALEHKILNWLNSIEGCFAVKINNTGIYDPKKRTWRKNKNPHAPNGIHDIILCYFGKFGSIEVKSPHRRPTPSDDQLVFLNNVQSAKGWSVVTNDLFAIKSAFISHFGAIKYKKTDLGENVIFDEIIK